MATSPKPFEPEGMKYCLKCREIKPLKDFGASKIAKDGLAPRCRACRNAQSKRYYRANIEKAREYARQRPTRTYNPNAPHNSPERERARYLARRAAGKLKKRPSPLQHIYNQLLERQNGVCAICQGEETQIDVRTNKIKQFAIDHCHSTGRIRGLLCGSCNTGLGLFRDDIEALQNAINYLQVTRVAPPDIVKVHTVILEKYQSDLPEGYQIEFAPSNKRLYVSYLDNAGVRLRLTNDKGEDKYFATHGRAKQYANNHAIMQRYQQGQQTDRAS